MQAWIKSGWFVGLLTVLALPMMVFNAQAAITFTDSEYDNAANTVTAGPVPQYNQKSGLFRDVFWWSINNGLPRVVSSDFINRGNSLILSGNHAVPGPGPYSALNFTGPSISGGQSYLTVYDSTPADGAATKNTFNASGGGITISTDVLFVKHNASAGIVALYNEGQDGLALLANNRDGNNPDFSKVSLVWQSVGKGQTLTSVRLPANNFVASTWYRITMNLTVNGDGFTVNGNFQNHVDGTNPNSALGSSIASLSFTGSLSDPDASTRVLTNPGEIGLMATGNESISLPDNIGVSFTNLQVVPVPPAAWLLGSGLIGLAVIRRRFRN